MKNNNKILVTGCAGFIGYFVCSELKDKNSTIVGLDSLNNYYDVELKKKRVTNLKKKKVTFYKNNLQSIEKIRKILIKHKINVIIHLAAQAGVRHSLKKPLDYVKNNIQATTCLLEACKGLKIKHFLFSSSSSVYGAGKYKKFKETDNTDFPIQYYAATKKSNELMLHSYSHKFKLPVTVMRFFTVYGPFGRPDMALFKFTKNIYNNKPIDLYNKGNHARDFTFINDNVAAILKLVDKPPKKIEIPNSKKYNYFSSNAKYRIVNVACGQEVKLKHYVKLVEKYTGKKSKKKYLELQTGDVKKISADITFLKKLTKYKPQTDVKIGVFKFIKWFKIYFKID